LKISNTVLKIIRQNLAIIITFTEVKTGLFATVYRI